MAVAPGSSANADTPSHCPINGTQSGPSIARPRSSPHSSLSRSPSSRPACVLSAIMSLQQRGRYLEELSTSLFHCQSTRSLPVYACFQSLPGADTVLSCFSILSVILPLLPTPEELALKSQVRTLLERLVRTVEPNCRLLRFGSTVSTRREISVICRVSNALRDLCLIAAVLFLALWS